MQTTAVINSSTGRPFYLQRQSRVEELLERRNRATKKADLGEKNVPDFITRYSARTRLPIHIPGVNPFEKKIKLTTPVRICAVNNWELEKNRLNEFIKLITELSLHKPRRLTDEEVESINGKSFRGTSLFLLLASCYLARGNFSINDRVAVKSKYSGEIEISYPLVAWRKQLPTEFANKYIDSKGEVVSGFELQEGNIFKRLLSDNGLEEFDIPTILLQPILLAFNSEPIHMPHHQSFEGICTLPNPNLSSLILISKLLGKTVEEMKEQYPLLTKCFDLS